ncbi:hypothetical protein Pmani_030486 [Petrolisthes manimaculis]|uniref:Uncharacterized protein n=1 Tax=Petrolisthes manimaculis TaxID=1843537 RepID=A0AAE1NX78_9EUCA|nr:hypothetical protein Pmani_030486 [Petrolisthes manimaculis]
MVLRGGRKGRRGRRGRVRVGGDKNRSCGKEGGEKVKQRNEKELENKEKGNSRGDRVGKEKEKQKRDGRGKGGGGGMG